VRASANRPPTIPSWVSESLPLSFDLAIEIGKFRRYMEEKFLKKESREEIMKFINKYLYVDDYAANAIFRYFQEQYYYAEIPSVKKLVIENYNDETRKYYIFHSLYGRRVNDVLSRAVAFAISRSQHHDVDIGISDNGFFIASEKGLNAVKGLRILKSEKIDLVMKMAIEKTEVLKRRFRHCATRALMILRNYQGRRMRVGRQQVSSMILISAIKRISNDFSILKEARREVLNDLMDIEKAKVVLKDIEDKKIKIKQIETKIPSPFALNLVMQGRMDVMRMEDKIEFLRRMHQMTMAKIGQKHRLE
jgi:ATP-dependent Lhr-like helicase